jgi:hypothetical protein
MSVRAKFYVSAIEQYPGNPGGKVKLSAVTRGARNASWSSATPSGTMEMQISNPEAFDWFREMLTTQAPEVFITIEVAPKAEIGDGHPFVLAEVPEDDYRFGKCADCGLPETGDLTNAGPLTGKPYHPEA